MWLFLQSLIVYGIIVWVMTYYGFKTYRYQYPYGIDGPDRLSGRKITPLDMLTNLNFMIPLFVFCLFAALRYKVGVDCESYKLIFHEYASGLDKDYVIEKGENGFKLICDIATLLGGSHYVYLFLLSFMQIAFLYYALRNQRYLLPFLGVAIMCTEMYLSLMNGVRQNIAACVFVVMIPYILQKKYLKLLLLFIIAVSFHKSAFILLILGIIVYFIQDFSISRNVQLLTYLVCFALMDKINIDIFQVEDFAGSIGYDERSIEGYALLELQDKRFGIIMMLQYVVYVMAICYSDKMKKIFNSKTFDVYYNLFFIGSSLLLLFYNNFTMGRILYYFRIFFPLVVSALLYVLWVTPQKKIHFQLALSSLMLFFLYNLFRAISISPEYILYKFDL